MPKVGPGGDHVYYVHAIDFDESAIGISRELFVEAVKAELPPTGLREHEGPLISGGYVKPLYLTPLYRTMIGYGTVQCPFRCPHYEGEASYHEGLCPNAEHAHTQRVVIHEMMRPPMSEQDLDEVASAFHKVMEHRGDLSNRKQSA
jgi:dTDP-4-amino-4,6-dideoxygalactose transaminase